MNTRLLRDARIKSNGNINWSLGDEPGNPQISYKVPKDVRSGARNWCVSYTHPVLGYLWRYVTSDDAREVFVRLAEQPERLDPNRANPYDEVSCTHCGHMFHPVINDEPSLWSCPQCDNHVEV